VQKSDKLTKEKSVRVTKIHIMFFDVIFVTLTDVRGGGFVKIGNGC